METNDKKENMNPVKKQSRPEAIVDEEDLIDKDLVDDDSLDGVFTDLKSEIIQKRLQNDNNTLNPLKSPYYCKLCGKEHVNYLKIRRCRHCGISLCKKCSSLGFCINCWIHLKEDASKTLKLFHLFLFAVPIALMLMLYRAISEIYLMQSYSYFLYFLASEFIMLSLLLGMNFYLKRRIIKNASHYFDHEWNSEINSLKYKNKLDPYDSKRYLSPEIIQDFERKKKRSIQKLEEWVNESEHPKEIPIPAFQEDLENEVEENIFDNAINPSFKSDFAAHNPKVEYKLINQPCPKCNTQIVFADFCPECNLRFCPECGEPNNPYDRICVCGFVFPSIKNEYFEYLRKIKKNQSNVADPTS